MRHCLTYIPEPGDLFWDNKDNKIVCCLENDISDLDTIRLERFYTMSDTEVYERPMNIPFNERYSPIENSPEMYTYCRARGSASTRRHSPQPERYGRRSISWS